MEEIAENEELVILVKPVTQTQIHGKRMSGVHANGVTTVEQSRNLRKYQILISCLKKNSYFCSGFDIMLKPACPVFI